MGNPVQLNLDFSEGSAMQLIKEYVSAILKFEVSENVTDYEVCETLWLKMVLSAAGGSARATGVAQGTK
jgi:uncharacterized protein YegJ (DUF2314 family)